jgi:hypothetical protein
VGVMESSALHHEVRARQLAQAIEELAPRGVEVSALRFWLDGSTLRGELRGRATATVDFIETTISFRVSRRQAKRAQVRATLHARHNGRRRTHPARWKRELEGAYAAAFRRER